MSAVQGEERPGTAQVAVQGKVRDSAMHELSAEEVAARQARLHLIESSQALDRAGRQLGAMKVRPPWHLARSLSLSLSLSGRRLTTPATGAGAMLHTRTPARPHARTHARTHAQRAATLRMCA